MKKLVWIIVIVLSILAVLFLTLVFEFTSQGGYPSLRVTTNRGPVFFGHAFLFFVMALILIFAIALLIRRIGFVSAEHEQKFFFYELIFATVDAGIILLDRSGLVLYINVACASLLGLEDSSGLHGVHYSVLADPILEPVSEKIATSLDAVESFTREYRVFLKEGIRCFLCSFVAGQDASQKPYFVLSLSDRTSEDEVRQKLSEQLEETHRYAVSKDNFFANISHEIRTPINAILGMTYFAKMEKLDKKVADYVQKIDNASELLLGVVNDILDFSKMQEHKFSLNPEVFNLFDLKKIILDLFSLKALQKGLEFTVNFDCGDTFFVYGDQFRLTQVFVNLVNNAVKFTEKGSVSVSLNHEIVGTDIILRCTVRDTGCGLTEDEVSKLFTDYEQFGQVYEKKYEGTGLGLAITKRLVELMQGVVWVDSTLNIGSSFRFVVVLQKPENLLFPSIDHPLPSISRNTGRVLVVEDNEINREIAGALLAENGFVVEYAEDGLDAIELCRSNDTEYYDVVLMDIHLPRMNGYDAAKVLRYELNMSCPIIAISATSWENEDFEKNKDVFSGYILKPYSPKVFKNLLAQRNGSYT